MKPMAICYVQIEPVAVQSCSLPENYAYIYFSQLILQMACSSQLKMYKCEEVSSLELI